MINLKDKAIRHQLIERYLDANSSIEEERALADFYRHCDKSELTDEDIDIRNMILGLSIAAQKETAAKTYQEKVSMGVTAKLKKTEKSNLPNKWVRFSALMLAAAMLVGLIFLVFPIKDRMAQKPNFAALAPTTQVIRSQQTQDDNEDLSPAEQMERQDSLFLAATKDIVAARDAGKVLQQKTKSVKAKSFHSEAARQGQSFETVKEGQRSEAVSKIHPSEAKSEATGDDIHQLYEVASFALPAADELKIDKQGSRIIISTLDEKGNSQHYTVDIDDAQDGIYEFHPLAQLNNIDD